MKRLLVGAAGLALGVAAAWSPPAPPAHAFGGEVFEITGAATQLHFEAQPLPGKKAFVNKITAKVMSACIAGTNPADGCAGRVENDAGGKAYIFFDSLTSWRMSTHLDGSEATTFEGLVDGAGNFMFAGEHAKSGNRVMLSGKVKFSRGTYTPTGINGKVLAVSNLTAHFFSGSFRSVGKAIVL
jgi:hypothetical protein